MRQWSKVETIPLPLSNLTQHGFITYDIPFPQIKISTNTYLMGNETVRNEMKQVLFQSSPDLELVESVVNMIKNTDISYLKMDENKLEVSKKRSLAIPLLQQIKQTNPSLFVNEINYCPPDTVSIPINSEVPLMKSSGKKKNDKLNDVDNKENINLNGNKQKEKKKKKKTF